MHYIPSQDQRGEWHVCYANHRNELISVLVCGSFHVAYKEAADMTLEATKRAICATTPETQTANIGNRYLRRYA